MSEPYTNLSERFWVMLLSISVLLFAMGVLVGAVTR